MAISGVSNDRNYTNILNSAGTDKVQTEDLSKKYGITYATEDNGSLSVDDFFTLMITQLTNQDFTNPTSDSEFMSQMTQYSSMQAIQEMAQYTRQNYAMSMVGKTVTASKYTNGNQVTETGMVEQLIKSDDGYQVKVNGNMFTLNQIQVVGVAESQGSSGSESPEGLENKTEKDFVYDAITALG
ncbi:MAG: hypothetical protein IJP18_07020 [Oscillospiraceae bacterium]|nr:hypothetical protein [Oscillospiraceae bacterium]